MFKSKTTGRNNTVLKKDSLVIPAVGNFIQQKGTNVWFKVMTQGPEALGVVPMFQTPTDADVDAGTAKDAGASAKTAKDDKDVVADAGTDKDVGAGAKTAKDDGAGAKTAKDAVADAGTAKDVDAGAKTAKDDGAGAKTAKDAVVEAGTAKDAKDAGAGAKTAKDVTPIITEPVTAPKLDPGQLTASAVVHEPKKFLEIFLTYWGDPKRLPDLSEGRSLDVKKLMFWKNMKCTASLAAHRNFPGCCAKWLHNALDFAISQNEWPVIFTKGETTFDMTVRFALTVWVCYAAQMNGSPPLEVKSAQKVSIVFSKCIFVFSKYKFVFSKYIFAFSKTNLFCSTPFCLVFCICLLKIQICVLKIKSVYPCRRCWNTSWEMLKSLSRPGVADNTSMQVLPCSTRWG